MQYRGKYTIAGRWHAIEETGAGRWEWKGLVLGGGCLLRRHSDPHAAGLPRQRLAGERSRATTHRRSRPAVVAVEAACVGRPMAEEPAVKKGSGARWGGGID